MTNQLDFSDIQLIALDMDGTTLNPNHYLSKRTIQAIGAIQEKGIKIIFATGRMIGAVRQHFEEAKIDGLVIAHNGAFVMDLKSNAVYLDQKVDSTIVKEVCHYAKTNQIVLHYNMQENVIIEKENDLSKKYASELNITYSYSDDLNKYKEQPTSLLLLQKKNILVKTLDDIVKLNLNHLNYVLIPWYDDYWMLQFLPNDTSKGKAVMKVAGQLGLNKDQVMSFGDSYNDLEMISNSGIGVAMGNACTTLKEIADYVTLSNAEDGVAFILEKMLTTIS